jgi:hypothetical protein
MSRSIGMAPLLLALACGGKDREVPRGPPPGVLGSNSPATIDQLAAACPSKISWTGGSSVICMLHPQELRHYEVEFDDQNLIVSIALLNFPDDEEIVRVFDRAIAPILPLATRDPLRRSITSPSGNFNELGGRSSDVPSMSHLTVSWFAPAAAPNGAMVKGIVWRYSPPRPDRTSKPK